MHQDCVITLAVKDLTKNHHLICNFADKWTDECTSYGTMQLLLMEETITKSCSAVIIYHYNSIQSDEHQSYQRIVVY